jgi:hypothetical protein
MISLLKCKAAGLFLASRGHGGCQFRSCLMRLSHACILGHGVTGHGAMGHGGMGHFYFGRGRVHKVLMHKVSLALLF